MHFTYAAPEGDLQQGDVLRISPDLKKVLGNVYPSYTNYRGYLFLMVLTQSCDLVRYGGNRCKARYITLGAVRSLETATTRELQKYQFSSLERGANLCSFKKRHWLKDFIFKLLNNNLPQYFYLAEDDEIGLGRPCAAFPQLAIPIKAEHYGLCLKARIAQLKQIFQAKLGWLVGNMYSRVGTPDWVPAEKTEDEFDALVEEIVEPMCFWVDDPTIRFLRKELKQRRKVRGRDYDFSKKEISELIDAYAAEQESRKKEVIDVILKQVEETIPTVGPPDIERLRRQLTFNEEVQAYLVRPVGG